jgi:hypothetical protein
MKTTLPLLWILCATPAWAQAPAALPDPTTPTAEDPQAVVRELAPQQPAREAEAKPSVETLQQMARLARAYVKLDQAKQARPVWTKLVAAFDRGGFARDGGAAAALAAEAVLGALQPDVAAGMARSLSPKTNAARPWNDLREALRELEDATLGPKPKQADGRRAGGLVDRLLKARDYGAPHWQAQAALTAGRVLMAQAKAMRNAARPAATDDTAAVEADYREASERYDRLALDVLEEAWKFAEEKGTTPPALRTDLRKELNKLRPEQYPLAETPEGDGLSKQQIEAARAAEKAMQSDNLQLRVKYLQRAIQLDPANPQYPVLLKQTQAELAPAKP